MIYFLENAQKGAFAMKIKRADPVFSDASGMVPGGIITYDPSKEGTGEKAEGFIKKICRSRLSLVLDDETPVAVARIYTYRPPAPAARAPQPALPSQPKTRPWFLLPSEEDEPPKDYVSFPF